MKRKVLECRDCIVAELLESGKSGTAVELRVPSALLVSVMLASIGSKETLNLLVPTASEIFSLQYIPTCSAFSQLRFILDWLSGSGNGSSRPASSDCGPLRV